MLHYAVLASIHLHFNSRFAAAVHSVCMYRYLLIVLFIAVQSRRTCLLQSETVGCCIAKGACTSIHKPDEHRAPNQPCKMRGKSLTNDRYGIIRGDQCAPTDTAVAGDVPHCHDAVGAKGNNSAQITTGFADNHGSPCNSGKGNSEFSVNEAVSSGKGPQLGDWGIQGTGQDGKYIKILQANITSLSKRVLKYLVATCDHDVVCIQEHKLSGNKLKLAVKKLSKYFQVVSTRAPIKVKGLQGGTMVLVRRGIATVYSGGLPGPKEDDFWSVQILRCSGYNLAIISIYLHPDDRVRNGRT